MKTLTLLILILIGLFAACSGPELEVLGFFEVSIIRPQPDMYLGRVLLQGKLSELNGSSVEDHGFIWSTSLEDLENNPENVQRHSLGARSDNEDFVWLTDALSLDSLYYFAAYAKRGERMMYSKSYAFIWGVNIGITNVERENKLVTINGFIAGLENSRARVSDYGFAYSSIHTEPTIQEDDTVSLGERNSDGAFQARIDSLGLNTTYYFRFYMNTQFGPYYDTTIIYRVTDGWEQLGYIDQPLTRAAVAYSNNIAYLGWGCTTKIGNCPAGNANGDFQRITNIMGVWEALPSIPDLISENYARIGAKAFIIGDKLYVGSGTYYNNTINQYASDLIQYNPQTGQWSEILDGMPGERVDAIAFIIDQTAYYGLGDRGLSTIHNDFYQFDPSRPNFQKWESMAPMNIALTQATAFSIGNKGYVVGGLAPGLEAMRRCWEFSPPDASHPQGVWTELPALEGAARYGGVAFVIGNKAYVGLGENYTGELSDFWEFDPSQPSDPWRQVTSFPGKARGRSAAFSINNLGYVIGGDGRDLGNNAFIPRTDSDVWVYYPETN